MGPFCLGSPFKPANPKARLGSDPSLGSRCREGAPDTWQMGADPSHKSAGSQTPHPREDVPS